LSFEKLIEEAPKPVNLHWGLNIQLFSKCSLYEI